MRIIAWVLMMVLCNACGGARPAATTPGSAGRAQEPEAPPLDERTERELLEAIALVDDGKAEKAIPTMQKLLQRVPGHPVLLHELALAFQIAKQPQGAAEVLQANHQTPGFSGSHYDLWVSSLDDLGQYERALAVANEGIAKFPTFGLLYTNAGIAAVRKDDLELAMRYFENGIAAVPDFPSNYYWAARVFSESREKAWTLIYGEVFMNLEPNTKRTAEISKLLYDSLGHALKIEGSGAQRKVGLGLTAGEITIDQIESLPFAMVYEAAFGSTLLSEVEKHDGKLSVTAIHQGRAAAADLWPSFELAKAHRDHPLLRFQREVAAAGHAEAYTYWLYSEGNPEEVKAWTGEHNQAWQSFITWFAAHRMRTGGNVVRKPRK